MWRFKKSLKTLIIIGLTSFQVLTYLIYTSPVEAFCVKLPIVNLKVGNTCTVTPPVTTYQADEIKTWIAVYVPPAGIRSIYPSADVTNPTSFTKYTLLPAMNAASRYKGYSNLYAPAALKYTASDSDIVVEENPPPQSPTGYDYKALFEKYNLCTLAKTKDIKAVILWAAGEGLYTGNMAESAITGTKGIPTNGPILSDLCDKTILILGLNYERGLAEALESYGHHLESVFRRFRPEYQDWSDESAPRNPNLWGKGDSCGIAHNPPNARCEYDASNPNGSTPSHCKGGPDKVDSDCSDWRPDGGGAKTSLDCELWGCNRAGWLTWWMQNMPGVDNALYDRLGQPIHNWWKLIGNPDKQVVPSSKVEVSCRVADGDVRSCDTISGCAYFFCSKQCWPKGTPLNVGCGKLDIDRGLHQKFQKSIIRVCDPNERFDHTTLDCIESAIGNCLPTGAEESDAVACIQGYRQVTPPRDFKIDQLEQACDNQASAVKLSWEVSPNSHFYKIFKKIKSDNSQQAEWEILINTGKTTYIDRSININQTYEYLIAAVSESKLTTYSDSNNPKSVTITNKCSKAGSTEVTTKKSPIVKAHLNGGQDLNLRSDQPIEIDISGRVYEEDPNECSLNPIILKLTRTMEVTPSLAEYKFIDQTEVIFEKADATNCQPYKVKLDKPGLYSLMALYSPATPELSSSTNFAYLTYVTSEAIPTYTTIEVSGAEKGVLGSKFIKMKPNQSIALAKLVNLGRVAGVKLEKVDDNKYRAIEDKSGAEAVINLRACTHLVSGALNVPDMPFIHLSVKQDNIDSTSKIFVNQDNYPNCTDLPITLDDIEKINKLIVTASFLPPPNSAFSSSSADAEIKVNPTVAEEVNPLLELTTFPETITDLDTYVEIIATTNKVVNKPNFEITHNGQLKDEPAQVQQLGCQDGVGLCKYTLSIPELNGAYQVKLCLQNQLCKSVNFTNKKQQAETSIAADTARQKRLSRVTIFSPEDPQAEEKVLWSDDYPTQFNTQTVELSKFRRYRLVKYFKISKPDNTTSEERQLTDKYLVFDRLNEAAVPPAGGITDQIPPPSFDQPTPPEQKDVSDVSQICTYYEQPQNCPEGGIRKCTGVWKDGTVNGLCIYDESRQIVLDPACDERCPPVSPTDQQRQEQLQRRRELRGLRRDDSLFITPVCREEARDLESEGRPGYAQNYIVCEDGTERVNGEAYIIESNNQDQIFEGSQ